MQPPSPARDAPRVPANEFEAVGERLAALRAARRTELAACARALARLRLAVDHALAGDDRTLAAALVERELALHAELQHHDAVLAELDALGTMLASRQAGEPPAVAPATRAAPGATRLAEAGDAGGQARRRAPRRALHALRKAITTLLAAASAS